MSSTTGAGSYRAVLALPYAAPTFGAALLGRLSFGLLPLSVLLTVQQATGSFALAGAVVGLFGLTSLLLPLKARLVDRYGQPRVLGALAATCSSALALLAAPRSAPGEVYVAIGLVAGLAAPPLGPSMRATWAVLTEGTALRPRAYALDSVCEEALYLVGPLLVGLVVAVAPARVALLATAAAMLVGTVSMVAVPSTWPRPRPSSRDDRSAGLLRTPGLPTVLLALLGVGAGLSAALTGIAARAQEAGVPAAAGYVEAAVAAGSVLGGLAWGRRRHIRSPFVHLSALSAVLAVGVALGAVAPGLLAAGVVMAITGLAVAPVFVVAYLATDLLVPRHQRTEAGTWVNTAHNVGASVGAAAVGVLVDAGGARTGLLSAAVLLGVTAVLMLAREGVVGLVRSRAGGRQTAPAGSTPSPGTARTDPKRIVGRAEGEAVLRGPGLRHEDGRVNETVVRRATTADWPGIWAVLEPVLRAGETYTYPRDIGEADAREAWTGAPGARVVVAVAGATVLGTAKYLPTQPGAGSHVANASFVVAPDGAGGGVGRALATAVLEAARADGFRAMQFNAVVETNVRAVRLWESLGFEVLATVPEAFDHPTAGLVGLHVMHRRL